MDQITLAVRFSVIRKVGDTNSPHGEKKSTAVDSEDDFKVGGGKDISQI